MLWSASAVLERHVIRNDEDVSVAVVVAQARARLCKFNNDGIQRLGTAVAELARNISKYCPGTGGDMLISHQDLPSGGCRLTLQFRDNGPGIADINQALQEHYSSSGTLGLGLSGVKRLVDQFEIVSEPGQGTVVTISLERRR